MNLTTDQMAQLLHKSRTQPRRNQKRYLKDLGGTGSAEELDEMLAIAEKNSDAVEKARELDLARKVAAKTVEAGVDGHVAEMIAALRVMMQAKGMTQEEMAEACGWNQSLVAKYLNGGAEPGSRNLAKMADALQCKWKLVATGSLEKNG